MIAKRAWRNEHVALLRNGTLLGYLLPSSDPPNDGHTR